MRKNNKFDWFILVVAVLIFIQAIAVFWIMAVNW
jgi:hypothetical protein